MFYQKNSVITQVKKSEEMTEMEKCSSHEDTKARRNGGKRKRMGYPVFVTI